MEDLLSLLDDSENTVAIEGGRHVSRRELRERSLRLRADLQRVGVGRGDCVAVWLPNWSDTLAWQFAAAALGAHVIGVNTRYNVEEVTHVLDRARPAVLAVAHGFHGLDLADRLHRAAGAAEAPAPSVAVVTGPGQPPAGHPAAYDVGAGTWTPSADGPAGEPPEHDVADELVVAFTTSGSTGKPKLAAHRQAAVTAHARDDAAAIGVRPGDVVLCALPLSGVFGFSTALAAIAGGATCLLEPVFDEDAVLADMARHGVTQVVGADDLVGRLAEAWHRGRPDLSTWRWLGIADFMGGVPELGRWAQTEFGTVVTGVYGSSEAFALTAFWPDDAPAPRRWAGGGRLVSPHYELRIVDPVSEEPAPTGERGELQLRGPNVVDAYLGSPDAAAGSFTADGWFRTGDLAELHPDGTFVYVCRMGDVLRLRGFLVEPAEIEFRLAAHEAVQTTKVVGVRDAGGATSAIAFVVANPGHEARAEQLPEELRVWCAEALAAFKVPAAVHLIEEMPTTSGTNGSKIRTAALRELAEKGGPEPAQ